MISDTQTNTVNFSELLWSDKHPKQRENARKIMEVLNIFDVPYILLRNTKDIWARDYMPIQVDKNRFVQYQYTPDYLQNKYDLPYQTDPSEVMKAFDYEVIETDIVIDGGNVVKSSNRVIMTDKVVKENQGKYTAEELIQELERLFEVEKVILIPQDKKDHFGHADGMLRFIDDSTVLANSYLKDWKPFEEPLHEAGIEIRYLEFETSKQSKNHWAYINFLQTKDLLLIPKFGVEEDEQALEQIASHFPAYQDRIAQVDMNEIAKESGALNCITWTIKS
jgi:agmatine deiminase